ncbi:MAG: peptidase C39 family protein [Eubacteriales bacterium]|nr:peptidase C39 family protein [Eubacteriales bacterium]
MNKKLIIALLTCLVMAFAFCMTGCGDSSSAPEKHAIGYPENYATNGDDLGADAYDGWCDDAETSYFTINDYFNMESEGTLHILNSFETYQQTTEFTCGPSSAHMVINWFDPKLAKKYDEMTISEMSGTDENTGVDPNGLNKFFTEIGWETQVNAQTDYYFEDLGQFEKFVIKHIDKGIPVMVDWIDWAGHWQVIVGIDTCQEDNDSDDVLILADPYDTSDQYQDGYYTFSAERFFYMWAEGSCTDKTGSELFQQPFLVAQPK